MDKCELRSRLVHLVFQSFIAVSIGTNVNEPKVGL